MTYRLAGNIDGKRFSVELAPGANRLGRSSKDADVVVPRDTVSRCHARIDVTDRGLEIQDLHSHNGTFVNGARIDRTTIRPGDAICLGDAELNLLQERGSGTEPGATTLSRQDTPLVTQSRSATFRSHAHLDSARLTWTQVHTDPSTLDDNPDLLKALGDLGSCLGRDEPGLDIGAVCLEHMARLFHFRMACLIEFNETNGEAEILSHYPAHLEPELEVSRTMVETVVRERKILLVRDVASEASVWDTAYKKGIRSAMVAPLMQGDQVLGVLYVDHENPLQQFETRHQQLLQLVSDLVAAKIASNRTRNEIEWAAFIQRRLLPESLPHPPGYTMTARLVPSHRVGGDLYEAMELPDGRYLYALGDVVGHGVGAALMMSSVLATLRALARRAESPLELASQLHEAMVEQLAPQGYVTLFLAFLDPRTHQLDYVTAGHPPPVLLRPGEDGEFLASTGAAIGMRIPVTLSSARIELTPGSLLAIWSDGLPEAFRLGMRPMQDFTQERLVARIRDIRHQPLDAILDDLFHESEAFVGAPRAQDDRTMVLLSRE